MEDKDIILERIKLVFKGEYNSKKCVSCQNEIENVDKENLTINFKDKKWKEKNIVFPVCDDCKMDVLFLIAAFLIAVDKEAE